tara:strand:+ start:2130 stop:2489 length:360 start_codon:yes stop_codon:yes gene_type:complete
LLTSTERPIHVNGINRRSEHYWKPIIGYRIIDNKLVKVVRHEQDEELKNLPIHPRHLFGSTPISPLVELTPRRLASDPDHLIKNYLMGEDRSNSKQILQDNINRSRDRRFIRRKAQRRS